jgi:hypothetical protein
MARWHPTTRRRPILRDNLPVFEITTVPGEVNAWSEIRLPFEPKGEMVRFRQQLVAAIKAMPPACDGQLVATEVVGGSVPTVLLGAGLDPADTDDEDDCVELALTPEAPDSPNATNDPTMAATIANVPVTTAPFIPSLRPLHQGPTTSPSERSWRCSPRALPVG